MATDELSQLDSGATEVTEQQLQQERVHWSLTDIEAAIAPQYAKVTYAKLRRFAETEGIGEYLGAVRVDGAKGVRYPATAVAQFEALLRAAEEGAVTPGTAKVWLRNMRQEPTGDAIAPLSQSVNGSGSSAIVPLSQSSNGEPQLALARAAGQAMADALIAARVVLPASDDRLVTKEEAAQALACPPGSVSRYVRPVRRGVYRWSDVQAYIAGLEPQARQARPKKGE